MTIRELALNLIEHADESPVEKIDLARAAEIIGWLDKDSDLPEDLTPEAFMEAFNDLLSEEENAMEKTLYTAVIEADDGIHLIRKAISDPTGEYEDFEYAMQNKADDLGGELHVIYCDEDIVEDVTIDDDPDQRIWYAVQKDREDDWGTGSYDPEEAKTMARKQREIYPDTLIAVIDNTNLDNPTCIGEITDF